MITPPTTTTAITPKPDGRWRRGLRHGLRTRHLPFEGGKAIERYRNKYRQAIEDELLGQGRGVGPAEATIIAAAVLAYEHSVKAGFWLANHHNTLTPDQRLTFSREEMRGMGEAAKLLKQLGIDRNPSSSDLWQVLQARTSDSPVHADQEATNAQNAREANVGDDNG